MPMLAMFALLLAAVLANVVNGKVGVGGYLGGGRPETWAITLVLFGAMLAIAGLGVKGRFDGVFIDKDNRISLSRFQLVAWTLLLVSALFTAGLSNAMPPIAPDAPPPLDIKIPPQIWALLGLGAFTAVAAPAIEDGKRGGPGRSLMGDSGLQTQREAVGLALQVDQKLAAPAVFDGRVLTKVNSADARWIDLIMGDYEGAFYVDVSKVQKLAFTVILVIIYGAGLWGHMAGVAPIKDFPAVSAGFLALLGISHAAYLADKQIAST